MVYSKQRLKQGCKDIIGFMLKNDDVLVPNMTNDVIYSWAKDSLNL